ncbi:unnamed protein product, partial [Phaeothamnion confervicola]
MLDRITILVLHGDSTAEFVDVEAAEGDVVTEEWLREALVGAGIVDVLKVKVHDGRFFDGKDLAKLFCSRLQEEQRYSAALRDELETERSATNGALDKLAGEERELRQRLEEAETRAATADVRLGDIMAALRMQKELRAKEALALQAFERERDALSRDLADTVACYNAQTDALSAADAEAAALRA